MLARLQKSIKEKDEGFTLIELLVVIIIIGILAAIAIPVFLNQRKKGQDAATKADVSTIGKEIATYYVDGTGTPGVTVVAGRYVLNAAAVVGPPAEAAITNSDLGKPSANVTLAKQTFTSSTDWCVSATNAQGDKSKAVTGATTGGFKYSASGGLEQGTCP